MTDANAVLDRVASLAAAIERRGAAVEDVTCDLTTTDGTAAVELSLAVPIEECGGEGTASASDSEPADATVDPGASDGGADEPADGTADRVGDDPSPDASGEEATDDESDGEVASDEETDGRTPTEGEGGEAPDAAAETGDGDDDRPIYRDPEALAEAYAATETFPEMRDELGVDVTAATVRRYAIEHDIHEPGERGRSTVPGDLSEAANEDGGEHTSDPERHGGEGSDRSDGDEHTGDADRTRATDGGATARGEGADAPLREGDVDPTVRDGSSGEADYDGGPNVDVAEVHDVGGTDDGDDDVNTDASPSLPDDLDLPDHVTPDEFLAAVEDASTIYEVTREIRVDRGTAKRLLRECGLLEALRGRRAAKAERDDEKAEILSRLHGNGS